MAAEKAQDAKPTEAVPNGDSAQPMETDKPVEKTPAEKATAAAGSQCGPYRKER